MARGEAQESTTPVLWDKNEKDTRRPLISSRVAGNASDPEGGPFDV